MKANAHEALKANFTVAELLILKFSIAEYQTCVPFEDAAKERLLACLEKAVS